MTEIYFEPKEFDKNVKRIESLTILDSKIADIVLSNDELQTKLTDFVTEYCRLSAENSYRVSIAYGAIKEDHESGNARLYVKVTNQLGKMGEIYHSMSKKIYNRLNDTDINNFDFHKIFRKLVLTAQLR